jgi:CBS domain-containing protein
MVGAVDRRGGMRRCGGKDGSGRRARAQARRGDGRDQNAANTEERAMDVAKAMHEGVEWRSPDTPLAELARLMREQDIGAVPIGENDRLIGMVTDRDIALRALDGGRDPASLTARDVMTEGIVYCRTSEDIGDAMRLMEEKQIRRLPVIDENRRMVGMLSLGDAAHAVNQAMAGKLTRAVAAHH